MTLVSSLVPSSAVGHLNVVEDVSSLKFPENQNSKGDPDFLDGVIEISSTLVEEECPLQPNY